MKSFKHLYPDKKRSKKRSSEIMTPSAKKVLLLLFVLFLLLFPHYAPWESDPARNHSIVGQIFSLYFFIANQTLGDHP